MIIRDEECMEYIEDYMTDNKKNVNNLLVESSYNMNDTIFYYSYPTTYVFGDELIKISEVNKGEWKITFYKKSFPEYLTNDYAREFIDIVENYIIKRR